ncbi:pilus assembly protein TadE [Methylobacillus sp. MM3]|jgi:Flp pilus assembly protein TadG|uniref:TadE/TadG family type IV pilus assembly protein n=1 Tax=Methylobacillus sp. MM3 TaxID=1848039 RepID=UPI0007DED1D2|nr:TadE/TadG family type IV pilus assembly protein [Methylobacillus sp. MM3]OAJ69959.1 pilus assembly protein TadE [Methylobacillus sp. MM3]
MTRAVAQRRKQKGAAAIEFALLFILFFAVFYALVSYAIAMLLQESFQHAAEEGARSAIAVDNLAFASNSAYRSGVEPRVRTTVGNSLTWLPTGVKSQVLGASNGNVQLGWSGTNTLTVTVIYTGYTSNPLIPILTLPAIGQVPKLPANLAGRAVIEL